MTNSFLSRRLVIAGLMAGVADVALADAPLRSLRPKANPGLSKAEAKARLAKGAESLIASAGLGGKVGYVVADAKTGKILETNNPVLPLPPASVAKAVTALYAIDALGSGYRFATRVVAPQGVASGVVKGDLVLVGSGDPTLATDDLAAMAKRLKDQGVTKITGKLRGWDKALPYLKVIDPEQPDHVGYNPAVSGLNLNFNRVHFEWKRGGNGYSVAMDARSDRHRPPVKVSKMQIIDRRSPVYTYRSDAGFDRWTVARSALGKGGSRWLPVRQPATYTLEVFRYFLNAQGISVEIGKSVKSAPKGTTLAVHQSRELRALCRDMLLYSTNITAEVLGLAATAAKSGKVASVRASARKMSTWYKGRTGTAKPDFLDHSGLSDDSRVSASDLVQSLIKLGPSSDLRGIMKTIPMRTSKGKIIKGSPIDIRAKTGTLNFVSALSGYVRTSSGRELAFTMFMADTKRRASIPKADREAPAGAGKWNKSAKNLQLRLIERWDAVYGA